MSNNFNIYKSENTSKMNRIYMRDYQDINSYGSNSYRNNVFSEDIGIRSSKGQKGEPGQQGSMGNMGFQGLQGDAGIRGPEGLPGVPGIQGTIGPQGYAGEPGKQGEQGGRGDKGEPGLGLKGQKGEIGIAGRQGIRGYKGEQGTQGIQGKDGERGSDGERGESGKPAVAANSIELSNSYDIININNNIINLIFSIPCLDIRGISIDLWLSSIKRDNILKLYDKNNINNNCIFRVISIEFTANNKKIILENIVYSDEIINKIKNVDSFTITTHNEYQEGPRGPIGETGPPGNDGPSGVEGPRGNIGERGPSSILMSDYWKLNSSIDNVPSIGTFTLSYFNSDIDNYTIYINKKSNSLTGELNYENELKLIKKGYNLIIEGPSSEGQIIESYNRIVFKIINIIELTDNYIKFNINLDKSFSKPNDFSLISNNTFKLNIGYILGEKGERGIQGPEGPPGEIKKPGTIIGYSYYNSIDTFIYDIPTNASIVIFESKTNLGNIANSPTRKIPFKISCKIPVSKRLLIEFNIKLQGLSDIIKCSLSSSDNIYSPIVLAPNSSDPYLKSYNYLTTNINNFINFNPTFYIDYNTNNIPINIGDIVNFYLVILSTNISGNTSKLCFGNEHSPGFSRITDLGILEQGLNYIPNLDDPNSPEFLSFL